MCLPWNHKWETLKTDDHRVWDINDDPNGLPRLIYKIIAQRCTHCGKEIVRKYRV
jgi:hypothetical protein